MSRARTFRRNAFRAARRERRLTQTEVSIRSGVSQSVISELERGTNTNPTWDVLSRLSQLYQRRPDDLIAHVKLPASAPMTETKG